MCDVEDRIRLIVDRQAIGRINVQTQHAGIHIAERKLGTALGIVLLVMLAFLGLRTGLVVATLIPMAMLSTLLLMSVFSIGLAHLMKPVYPGLLSLPISIAWTVVPVAVVILVDLESLVEAVAGGDVPPAGESRGDVNVPPGDA